MKNKYEALRSLLRERYMKVEEMAAGIGRSVSYVSQRMSGARQWELSDIYAIMELLEIPAYQMPAYFTKNGERANPPLVRPPLTDKQAEVIAAYDSAEKLQSAVDILLGIGDKPIHRRNSEPSIYRI